MERRYNPISIKKPPGEMNRSPMAFPSSGIISFILQAVFLLLLGFLNAASQERPVPDWRFYTRSEFGSYQYDAGTIGPLSKNLVRVRQKLVLNEKGKACLVTELGKEYENVEELITLREIDCEARKTRILELTYSSTDGAVIKREPYESGEWDSVLADSVDDILYHKICR
jgi:hypothetical protein